MSDQATIRAFLLRKPKEGPRLRSEGGRLVCGDEVIASWDGQRLTVVSDNQGTEHEALKDMLFETALMKMRSEGLFGKLVRGDAVSALAVGASSAVSAGSVAAFLLI